MGIFIIGLASRIGRLQSSSAVVARGVKKSSKKGKKGTIKKKKQKKNATSGSKRIIPEQAPAPGIDIFLIKDPFFCVIIN